MASEQVSVVGLGRLGLPMLAAWVSRGCQVVGVDQDETRCRDINQGIAPWHEAGLQEVMTERRTYYTTGNYEEAVMKARITFIVVPTPSEAEGGFSNQYVLAAAQSLGFALRQKSSWHLVVLTSTVMPETTTKSLTPTLERASGKVCGRDFGVCYSPTFIALGSVINDLLNPDLVLIGESDKRSGDVLTEFYTRIFCGRELPPLVRMNPVNAELAKLALNTFVTMKITFANTLAAICEGVQGANAFVVAEAIGHDRRIGSLYLRPGMSYGGPCFPRDNRALERAAKQAGVDTTLAGPTDALNRYWLDRFVERIQTVAGKSEPIGLIGLAYKPETPVVTESAGLECARRLSEAGYRVVVYDPWALTSARDVLGEQVQYAASLEACVAAANTLILTLPLPALRSSLPSYLRRGMVIIDGWGQFISQPLPAGIEYHTVGRGAY